MSSLMQETSAYYHGVLGQDCPWDCARCPSNVANERAEQEESAMYTGT